EHDLVADDGAVDHAVLAGGEDVAFPIGAFEPEEVVEAAGEGDEVGVTIVIEVGDDDLVTAAEVVGDDVLGEFWLGLHQGGDCEEKQDSHAPQYTWGIHS